MSRNKDKIGCCGILTHQMKIQKLQQQYLHSRFTLNCMFLYFVSIFCCNATDNTL